MTTVCFIVGIIFNVSAIIVFLCTAMGVLPDEFNTVGWASIALSFVWNIYSILSRIEDNLSSVKAQSSLSLMKLNKLDEGK